jgi:DNA-binding transcriptional LysR family regulator
VTLTQLAAFVLVARLGSVTAAAQTLGVSEPAVSQALAALRKHLGDPLVQRAPSGMELTVAGKRLVSVASQIVSLVDEAEHVVREAQGAPERIRVVATSTVAEFAAPALVEAFSRRSGAYEITLGTATMAEMPALLSERLADVALGPSLPATDVAVDSQPLLRYRLVFVASPRHHLSRANGTPIPVRALADEHWLVDPAGADPTSEVGTMLARLAIPPARVHVFPSTVAAWDAAAEGHGVAPAILHGIGTRIERGTLRQLPVSGTPVELLWHVTTLGAGRRSNGADAFRQFVGTPDALQAMHAPTSGVPATRFRPPVYVTIWS